MEQTYIWIGIVFCLTQSAIFSGLNLAFFSLTRLRLEIQAEEENSPRARKVLQLRKDSNFLLTTILWGNVGINVLLTLLSESVMTGLVSFTFSTVAITLLGEIIPQAYFSRNALRMAAMLTPIMRFYQVILFPIAKPCAIGLDQWLGKESAQLFSERNIKLFIKKHIDESESEIEHLEGTGAINFLTLDDKNAWEEGEPITEGSIISLSKINGKVRFPEFEHDKDDPFIRLISASGEKWVVFTDEQDHPIYALDADGFLRGELLDQLNAGIKSYCHNPVVSERLDEDLGNVVKNMRGSANEESDEPIEKDVVLLWTAENKRIITGADLFGRLLKGI